MKKKAKIVDDFGREVVRYENNGATPEERRKIAKENGAKFERDAQAGAVCCISDLIGQAEQCHIDRINEREAKQ